MPEMKPVLAMYDIRGKQEFIFRTNKLQEIVGGSWIIRDLFSDYLFSAAKKAGQEAGAGDRGIFSYKKERPADSEHSSAAFSEENFRRHLAQGYIGEVVYDGGGNFLLLFRNADIFRKVTYAFTRKVMEEIGTLRVLGTCIEIDGFSHYDRDSRLLYARHRINEAQESNINPWACLPIVQVDRKTSMPIIHKNDDRQEEWSQESFAKIRKYRLEIGKMRTGKTSTISDSERSFYLNNEDKLDNLVLEKGTESQIAVIYIDGNNMGAKVQKAISGLSTYEDCIKALRAFSDEIQRVYVEKGIERALTGIGDSANAYRIVVSAGDEINFIVNAHDAFRCALNYLNGLKDERDASACAGIAVFNSHAPYADAYRIAEEACESGKIKMRGMNLQRACFVDYHFCQGAIGMSLEKIREEESEDVISRPWLVWKEETSPLTESCTDYTDVEKTIRILQQFGRSNVKGLMQAALVSETSLEMELNRMFAHLSEEKKAALQNEWNWLASCADKRSVLYDIVAGYDMWFSDM